jgi:hypothetical protein
VKSFLDKFSEIETINDNFEEYLEKRKEIGI